MSDTSDLPPAKRPKIEDDAQSSQDSQTYGLHVTAEEVDQLREFQVLDEVKCDDEDSNDEGSDKTDSSDGLPEEEIDRMLEEDLPEDFKGVPKAKAKKYIKRQKIILEEKGINYFEVLPLDWMMVRHCSGMPVYMHRASRVCTLSKPYFLGKGNTRRHDIPISAIPCLAYRIALKEEQKQMEIDKQIAEQIKNGTWTDPNNPTQKTMPNGAPEVNRAPEVNKAPEANRAPEVNGAPEVNEVEMGASQNDVSEKSDAVSEKSDIKAKCPFTKNMNELKQHGVDSPKLCYEYENSQDSEIGSNVTVNAVASDETSENNVQTVLKDEIGQTTHIAMDEQESQQATNSMNTDDQDHTSIAEEYVSELPGPALEGENVSEIPDSALGEEKVSELPGPALEGENVSELPSSALEVENVSELPSSALEVENVSELPGSPLGEENQSHLNSVAAQPVLLPGGIVMPPPRVETVSTSWKSQQLTAEELNAYCKKLFKFKEVYIMHFKRWADRRKYTKARKTMQYPTLPEGTKLITIPANDTGDQNGGGKTAKRDWVMNMNGCSYLSVFHEYVRRALHKQPVYEFKQLENATAPYQATVYIGGMQYGVGRGSSKRQAKSQAARASIHILIPEMRDELPTSPGDLKLSKDDPDFTFFDYVSISDPRIQEFCGAAAEPSPHAILRTCLLRNFGAGDRHIHTEMKKLEFQKIELTMKVGKHSATVVCKNKKQAKQRASQHILQQLHPHITSWGSLLRLYGSRSMKSCKEKKLEEQQITLLQDKARHNEPNHAVLDKLRNEMTKLKERDNAVVPIGTLLVSEDLPTHSGSNLNNVDL